MQYEQSRDSMQVGMATIDPSDTEAQFLFWMIMPSGSIPEQTMYYLGKRWQSFPSWDS